MLKKIKIKPRALFFPYSSALHFPSPLHSSVNMKTRGYRRNPGVIPGSLPAACQATANAVLSAQSPNTCGSPASIPLKRATGKTYTGKPIRHLGAPLPLYSSGSTQTYLFISNSDLLPLLMPSRGSTSQRKFFQVLPSTCMLPPPSLPPCCFHRVQAAGGLSPVIASPSSPALCGAHSHTVTQLGRHTMPPPAIPHPPSL